MAFAAPVIGADVREQESVGGAASAAGAGHGEAGVAQSTLSDVATTAQIGAEVVEALATSLGGEPTMPLSDLAFIPSTSLDLAVQVMVVNGMPATPIQQGRANKLLRLAFAILQVKPVPVAQGWEGQPTATSSAEQGGPPPNVSSGVKRKFSEHLAQGEEGEFEPFNDDQMKEAMLRYKRVCGKFPKQEAKPTPEQLGALAARIASRKAPYADFAIFSPDGKKAAKKRKFSALIMVDYVWVTRLLNGPADFHAWAASWKVFRTAMIMLGAACPDDLDSYADGIKDLADTFPLYWGMILEADESMRSEEWDQIRFEFSLHSPAEYDAENPWSYIIENSAFLAEGGVRSRWWQRRLVLPLSGSGKPEETAARLSGAAIVSQTAGPKPAGQSLPSSARPKYQAQAQGAGAVAAPKPCPDFNAGKKPCKASGKYCHNGLAHVCSICGKDHPRIRSKKCRNAGS